MRVISADSDNIAFISWLQDLSYKPSLNDCIQLLPYIQNTTNLKELYNFIFPQELLLQAAISLDILYSRAILTTRNSIVSDIYDILLNQHLGPVEEYLSMDSADVPDAAEFI